VHRGFWWGNLRERARGRPRHRWTDNIKNGSSVSGMGSMDWIDLPQDRDGWRTLVNEVMHLRVP